MNNFRYSAYAVCLCALLFSGCKKDEVDPPQGTVLGNSKLLAGIISKTWKYNQRIEDGVPYLDSCYMDIRATFYADSTWLFFEAFAVCNWPDSINLTGTWELRNNNTELVMMSPEDTVVNTVIRLTATNLDVTNTVNGLLTEEFFVPD